MKYRSSTLYLALNTGKGSKGGAPAAEVSLNLHVTINQTENSDYPENSGIQSSNMKSDLHSSTRHIILPGLKPKKPYNGWAGGKGVDF